MTSSVDILNKPLTFSFSKRTSKNRFMKAAMSERIALFSPENPQEHGKPTDDLVRLYETWGKGEIGIILTGNIMVKKDHLEAPGNLIIDSSLPSSYLEEFTKIANAAKAHGSLVLGQLNHTGCQTVVEIQPHPVSASDVQVPTTMGISFGKPTPLTKEGIKDVVESFAYAAGVLHKAGFDGIELHGAHGYLITQFLSPRTNKRTDEYGGSLANRSRFVLEILEAIKRRVADPSFILAVKLNSQDFIEDGFSAADSRELCVLLEHAGIDMVELSGGSFEYFEFEHKRESTKKREAFFLEFAELLRPNLSATAITVTGGFRSAAAMADAIKNKATDIIGLARPLTAEPHLPKAILSGEQDHAKVNKVPAIISLFTPNEQIAEISKGLPITDYSDDKNIAALLVKHKNLLARAGELKEHA